MRPPPLPDHLVSPDGLPACCNPGMSESTSDPPAAAKARRPGTVVAAALLLALGAIQAAWFAFSGSADSGSAAVLGMLPWWGLLLYAPLYVVLAWGVWTGRRGARILVLVVYGLGAALAVADLLQADVSTGLTGLIWPVVFAILLNTVSAREWFGREPDGSANPGSAV